MTGIIYFPGEEVLEFIPLNVTHKHPDLFLFFFSQRRDICEGTQGPLLAMFFIDALPKID